jgi:DNA-binding response OmpR family regulator
VITNTNDETVPALPGPLLRPVRVLVVDDERDTVDTLSAILVSEGYSAFGLYKGTEVLHAVEEHEPDAVILDIDLPGGPSGFALAREICARYGRFGPMLIAISGKWIGQTDRMLGYVAGFHHYCLKPCEPDEVLKLLEPLRNRKSSDLLNE